MTKKREFPLAFLLPAQGFTPEYFRTTETCTTFNVGLVEDRGSTGVKLRNFGGTHDALDALVLHVFVSSPYNADSPPHVEVEMRFTDIHRLTLRDAQALGKTAAQLDRRWSALYERLGSPADFKQQFLRACTVVGVDRVYQYADVHHRGGYDDCEFNRLKIADASHALERIVNDLLSRLAKREAA